MEWRKGPSSVPNIPISWTLLSSPLHRLDAGELTYEVERDDKNPKVMPKREASHLSLWVRSQALFLFFSNIFIASRA